MGKKRLMQLLFHADFKMWYTMLHTDVNTSKTFCDLLKNKSINTKNPLSVQAYVVFCHEWVDVWVKKTQENQNKRDKERKRQILMIKKRGEITARYNECEMPHVWREALPPNQRWSVFQNNRTREKERLGAGMSAGRGTRDEGWLCKQQDV